MFSFLINKRLSYVCIRFIHIRRDIVFVTALFFALLLALCPLPFGIGDMFGFIIF